MVRLDDDSSSEEGSDGETVLSDEQFEPNQAFSILDHQDYIDQRFNGQYVETWHQDDEDDEDESDEDVTDSNFTNAINEHQTGLDANFAEFSAEIAKHLVTDLEKIPELAVYGLDEEPWEEEEQHYYSELNHCLIQEHKIMSDMYDHYNQLAMWVQISHERELERALSRIDTQTKLVEENKLELVEEAHEYHRVMDAFDSAMHMFDASFQLPPGFLPALAPSLDALVGRMAVKEPTPPVEEIPPRQATEAMEGIEMEHESTESTTGTTEHEISLDLAAPEQSEEPKTMLEPEMQWHSTSPDTMQRIPSPNLVNNAEQSPDRLDHSSRPRSPETTNEHERLTSLEAIELKAKEHTPISAMNETDSPRLRSFSSPIPSIETPDPMTEQAVAIQEGSDEILPSEKDDEQQ